MEKSLILIKSLKFWYFIYQGFFTVTDFLKHCIKMVFIWITEFIFSAPLNFIGEVSASLPSSYAWPYLKWWNSQDKIFSDSINIPKKSQCDNLYKIL